MKNRKVYRPGGMPTYRAGGKAYSTKGYKKMQKSGGVNKMLTNHQFVPDLEFIGDAVGAYLGYQAIQQQQDALQEMYNELATPGAAVQAVQGIEGLLPESDPNQTLANRIAEIEGRSTDVEIDTTALDDQRGAQEQTTANVLANLSRGGTKGMAGLSQVLDAQNKSDLALTTQALNIEGQEAQLEEAAKKSKEADLTALSTTLGGQDFKAEEIETDIYKQELGSIADLKTALSIAMAQGAGAGTGFLSGVFSSADGSKVPNYQEGGVEEKTMEEGEEIMPAGEADISPGEEEHSTNPIDLVKDGKKIGEMTGGEVIMPSKNVEQLEVMLAQKNAEGVMELMATLMMKWNKKAQEYAEKEIGGVEEARGGMKTYKPMNKINY
jgi:hypothetical protein